MEFRRAEIKDHDAIWDILVAVNSGGDAFAFSPTISRCARQREKKFLRLDTWGDNENLKNYYIHCGFNFVSHKHLTKDEAANMPAHYCGLTLSLFEIAL